VYPIKPDEFSNSWATHLRPGPDGALWFSMGPVPPGALGRITTAGAVTTWPLPWSGGDLSDFTFGAGYLWSVDFHGLDDSYIGKWSLTGTLLQEFPVPATAVAITWGPDGALWFSGATVSGMDFSDSFVGRMTVQGVVTKYSLPDGSNLAGDLMPGPDGAVWFTELPGSNVGRITTSGSITEYNVPSKASVAPTAGDQTLATGPDGALWAVSNYEVARITTTGRVSVLPPFLEASSIAVDPHGDLWVIVGDLVGGNNALVRATTSGSTIAAYPVGSTIHGSPTVVTTGPDGMIWFGDQGAIGRLDPSIPPNS
jgi:virginiamycin B lyase